ncbi:aldehyde dehydrogenase [Flavisphingomonas formosensis]|uniref:aldehyde dehydrogenase n=1 Tax=Flavisphingomonas formosensis TaxID=861534 RepID=UPI0012FAE766|nr:aldehyde dehydrogenase [Sphingomonas formosensis]
MADLTLEQSSRTMIRHPDRFFIGGEWVAPSTDTRIDVITPSTEELFVSVAEAKEADMNRAVASARATFDRGEWRRLGHAERGRYVKALGDALRARAGDVVRIWTSEMGVTRMMGMGALHIALDAYDQYAELANSFPFEERHPTKWGGEVGLLVREPVGVVGAIIPWNAPPVLIAYKIAPALVAGCTVVLKASPEAPASAYFVAEMAERIGLPKGVLNVVTADREVSELLVRHPDVDKITFTGSSAAGRRIASLCGERIARCTLELGGKSAAVVLDDYDVGAVAASISGTARVMTGQVCSSITRIVVNRKRHDAMVDALSAEFARIRVGDPFADDVDMGPLAMSRQRERVENFIAAGLAEGAVLACGGRRPNDLNRGFYIEPTVFGDVDNASTIAREEIFGPVISIIPADDEEQAVAIANDTIFGLNASVFTNDIDRAYAVMRELRSGTVGHNGARGDFSIAFGGFKQSGIGREGGREGLLPFLESKTMILDGRPSHLHG